jgi:hypothetical protein
MALSAAMSAASDELRSLWGRGQADDRQSCGGERGSEGHQFVVEAKNAGYAGESGPSEGAP